jgi:threonine 3-dehydrogenase
MTDISKRPNELKDGTPFCYLNILDSREIERVVVNNDIDTIIHFSALLSAVGENNVPLALQGKRKHIHWKAHSPIGFFDKMSIIIKFGVYT